LAERAEQRRFRRGQGAPKGEIPRRPGRDLTGKWEVRNMSYKSIRAIDLFIRVRRLKDLEESSALHSFVGESKRWAAERGRELMKFRSVMAKVTQEEFLAGRWGHTPMQKRMRQWNKMKALL